MYWAMGLWVASRAWIIGAAPRLGNHLARIFTGGDVPSGAAVTEQALLDLEREAFLQLCGQPKTLERIQYTLKTGKTLRN